MATRIPTTELKVGMFVADLDRPWVDTPFLLQGFLIEDEEQIRELMRHCQFVMVDRTRSTGDQYEAAILTRTIPPEATRVVPATQRAQPTPSQPARSPAPEGPAETARPRGAEARERGEARRPGLASALVRASHASRTGGYPAGGGGGEGGFLGRLASGFKGLWQKDKRAAPQPRVEPAKESAQDFEARAALAPPGVTITTYVDRVSVEEEVPYAEEVVERTASVLEKLVHDIRLGGSFELDEVQEVVDEMVESIVRNPDALMWVARLREQDIGAYGHGLQVSVYLTAFGRHLGFPKPLLASLAQIGLLLDVGKIRLPREILEKQGRLTPEEFEQVKEHVRHSLDILSETPNFDPEVLQGIAQHHERMNGSGYPGGLMGDEIAVTGRMAGIVDCFAALINHRPYASAVSSYEALRSITGWGGDYFHEPLVQQFVSSVGVFPVGSLIELSSGEVAIVVSHNKLRRLKPRVLVVTGPDKQKLPHPAMVDLLYDPRVGEAENVFIKRGLAAGAYGLDLGEYYVGPD